MSDSLRDRIAAAIAKVVVSKNLDVRHHDLYDMADAVTDLLVDMAGHGELLAAINRIAR